MLFSFASTFRKYVKVREPVNANPPLTPYQKEQLDCLFLVRGYWKTLGVREKKRLDVLITDYLRFRRDVGSFFQTHFAEICSEKCFRSRLSACCSRDGIITFFADVAVNVFVSGEAELDGLQEALENPHQGSKCIYLGAGGCLWRVKPVVCEMFLCDAAKEKVFGEIAAAKQQWDQFIERKKQFTWPDCPVLFDILEDIFIKSGYDSSLMYMHSSPGLLRVKKQGRKRKV